MRLNFCFNIPKCNEGIERNILREIFREKYYFYKSRKLDLFIIKVTIFKRTKPVRQVGMLTAPSSPKNKKKEVLFFTVFEY